MGMSMVKRKPVARAIKNPATSPVERLQHRADALKTARPRYDVPVGTVVCIGRERHRVEGFTTVMVPMWNAERGKLEKRPIRYAVVRDITNNHDGNGTFLKLAKKRTV